MLCVDTNPIEQPQLSVVLGRSFYRISFAAVCRRRNPTDRALPPNKPHASFRKCLHLGHPRYAIPAGVLAGGYFLGHALGFEHVTEAAYLASSGLCIAAIACLANQSTARTGNALGLVGVG